MKKVIIILMMLITADLLSQSGDVADFLPLKVGNTWIYKWKLNVYMPPTNDSGFYKVTVDNSIIINNKIYFTFITFSGGCGATFGNIFANNILRIDSVSGNVMKFDSINYCSYSSNEIMVDSLKMRLHDSLNYNCQTGYLRRFCDDTAWQNIFGSLRPSKSELLPEIEAAHSKRFVKGVGLCSFGYNGENINQFFHCNYTLQGCIINGIVYGDTCMTGVNKTYAEVPDHFSLSQNYPNPFNPNTNIKFQIAKLSDVKLIIYDVLGREITTLVNEQLKLSTYEVEWDGTNYPSGVYFYKLITQYYSETRKMVLIK